MHKIAIEFYGAIRANSVTSLRKVIEGLPNEECELLVLIGSCGGDITHARMAYSCLATLPKTVTVTTCGCGNVDSAAVILFCAGSKRICLPHTRFLIHNATINATGLSSNDALKLHYQLMSDDDTTATLLSKILEITYDSAWKLVSSSAFWNAEIAKNNKLVTEIIDVVPKILEGWTINRIYDKTE